MHFFVNRLNCFRCCARKEEEEKEVKKKKNNNKTIKQNERETQSITRNNTRILFLSRLITINFLHIYIKCENKGIFCALPMLKRSLSFKRIHYSFENWFSTKERRVPKKKAKDSRRKGKSLLHDGLLLPLLLKSISQ